MIKPPVLLPGESVVTDRVPLYGPGADFLIRYIMGPVLTIAAVLLFAWLARVFSGFATNPATARIGAYQAIYRFYPLILLVLAAVALHFFASLYLDKVTLTSRAVLKRALFATDRVEFGDIASVVSEREPFTSVRPARQRLHLLAALPGLNYMVTVRTASGHALVVRYMSRSCADELKRRLDAARSPVPVPPLTATGGRP